MVITLKQESRASILFPLSSCFNLTDRLTYSYFHFMTMKKKLKGMIQHYTFLWKTTNVPVLGFLWGHWLQGYPMPKQHQQVKENLILEETGFFQDAVLLWKEKTVHRGPDSYSESSGIPTVLVFYRQCCLRRIMGKTEGSCVSWEQVS